MQTGPSYSTKREEAKEGMIEFIRSAPATAPVVMDLVAKAQDWPLADEFGKRLEAIAPAPVQKLIANQKKENGEEQQPEQPTPMEQMQQELQLRAMKAEVEEKEWQVRKLQAETAKIAGEAAAGPEPGGIDPVAALRAVGQDQKNMIDAAKGEREIALLDAELADTEISSVLDAGIKREKLNAMRTATAQGACDQYFTRIPGGAPKKR